MIGTYTMKRILVVVLTLGVILSCVSTVSAAEDEEAPLPPPVSLPIPSRLQQTQVWCWVAVTQQVLMYSQGQSPAQCELVATANSVPTSHCCASYNPSCVRTGSMEQIRLLLLAYGNRVSDVIPTPRDPYVLYRHVRDGHPVILQIRSSMTTTHVVVLRAVTYMRSNDSIVAVLSVNDPMSVYTQNIEYSRLRPHLVNALVVY